MRQESNLINQRIKELEKAISMIKNQQILKEDKEKAIIDRKAKTKNNQNYHKNIMLISLILLGLMIGANLANLFNKIFNNDKTN